MRAIFRLLVALAALSGGDGFGASPPLPNIILILADDLGFSDLGCYGGEIETPNLDRLATNGLRFTSFYNTAKCESSRVSILSGLYSGQAGGRSLSRAVTIPEVLRNRGYITAMAGKWHLEREPTDRGFERFFGHLSGATNFFTGDETFRFNGQPWSDFREGFYTTDANTDHGLGFIDEAVSENKPFFLYLAYNAPHYPLQAPREDVEKYRGRYDAGWDAVRAERYRRQLASGLIPASWALSPRPEHVRAWDTLSAEDRRWESDRMAVYAAMVDRLDRNVGRLTSHLEANGLLENTLILFCSDNGACPFERTKGREFQPWDPRSYWTYDVGWAHVGNTPFRLYKQNQSEGGTASPLIVHWPAGLRPARDSIIRQPGHLVDIMATCLDASGAEYPRIFDGRAIDPLMGRSLLPLLRGRERGPHPFLYFHFGTDRAWREGDWKLLSVKGGPWELYDLARDPTELHDMARDEPDRVRALAEAWLQFAREVDRLGDRDLRPVADEPPVLRF